MTKQEFLQALQRALTGFPEEDVEQSLEYYSEIIEDRIEEGKSEEEAVAALGSIEEIRKQILSEIPMGKLVGAKFKPKRALRGWEIALLILGFPLWFPLLLTVAVLALTVYALIWVAVAATYIVDFALVVGGVALVLSIIPLCISGNVWTGVMGIGVGLVAIGLGILFFFLCKTFLKGVLLGSKACLFKTKDCIVGRREGV